MAETKRTNIKNTMRKIFGSLRYTPPEYIRTLLKNTRKISRRTLFTGGIVGILGVLIWGGTIFWQSLQPELISVDYRIIPPIPPEIDDEERIQPLTIVFSGSASLMGSREKEAGGKISIKPSIDGQWRWDDDRTLLFQPSVNWGIAQKYKISMDKELFPSHIRVKSRQFEFSTVGIQIEMEDPTYYIDPTDEKIKRVLATLKSNYSIDTSTLNEYIRIFPDLKKDSGRLINRDYNFNLVFEDNARTVYIVSEPIEIPLDDVEMVIEIKKGVLNSRKNSSTAEKLTRTLTISGLTSFVEIKGIDFKLLKDENQIYNQYIIVETKGDISGAELARNMEIWELPRDLPDLPGLKGQKDIRWGWNTIDLITDEVLELSRKVDGIPLPTEVDYTSLNSFAIDVTPRNDPEKYLYVRIGSGTPFYGGYHLASDYETVLTVKEYPKEVSFVTEGNVLSMSGSKKLSLFTRGIDRVHYRIHRIIPDDINHLVSQSNGSIRNLRYYSHRFNVENISRTYKGSRIFNSTAAGEVNYFSIDMTQYLATIPEEHLRYGLFSIEVGVVDIGGEDDFQALDRRLIIVSDLGLLVKTGREGRKDVFIQSIAAGRPLAGVQVQILGKNGIPLTTRFSNNGGHTTFPYFEFSNDENQPMAIVATIGNDLSFLPYESPGQFLDYSNFDTGGIYGAGDPKKITAQVFSDRGIYRPGDQINGAIIVKAGRWETNIQGTPLILRVIDPAGLLIYEKKISLSADGFSEFSFVTQDFSPTGRYALDLYLVREERGDLFLGGDTISVEEFLPDRLMVLTSILPSSTGWVLPEKLEASVTVRNLHGIPASDHRVSSRFSLNSTPVHFQQYRDYHFLEPGKQPIAYNKELPDFSTDDEGAVTLPLSLARFEKRTYRLNLSVSVYEKAGGRSVESGAEILVSPSRFLIGYQADGDLSFIHKGSERNVELIAINPELEKISLKGMTLALKSRKFITTLVKQPDGVFKYQSVEKEQPITSTPISIDSEGTILPLNTSEPGNYSAEILNEDGDVTAQFDYTVAGEIDFARSLNRSAELEIKLNKNDYKEGELIEVSINAPYPGAGLITIEADKVYTYKWFKTDSTSTVQTIEIPANSFEGNAYVSVVCVRAPDSTDIFMSPLSSGSVPFFLDREKRTQSISLDYPDLIEPGKELKIDYSSNRRGRIIIYAVDEGILQVGRYTTPDPLAYFFKKRALEVNTAQILDLILPDYSIVKRFSAAGGGMSAEMLINNNLNPFKKKNQAPVVFWSGILESSPQTRSVSYKVPDYFNGSLRIMAVCVSKDAVGSRSESTLARSTFVIQPSAPLAAAGGDRFSFQATVSNNLEGSGENAEVIVTLKGSKGLIIPETSRTVIIPEGRDEVVKFPVEVGDMPGSKDLTVNASSGGKSSSMIHSLSVRPLVPFRTTIISGVSKQGGDEIPINRRMYPDFRKLEVSASYLPIGLAGGLNYYLSEYSYICTEQLISKTFPLLYSGLIKNLNIDREEAAKQYSSTMSIMQARQQDSGGFGTWTIKSPPDPLIDLHSFHFLLESERNGFHVPRFTFEHAASRVEEIASIKETGIEDMRLRAFATFLLTLSGTVTTRFIEEIRADLKAEDTEWKSDLIGLYLASSYSLLQMKSQAAAILRNVRINPEESDFANGYNDRLSYLSQYLWVLSSYDKGGLGRVSSELLNALSLEISANHFSTYSASLALVAIQAYVDAVDRIDTRAMEIMEYLENQDRNTLSLSGEVLKSTDFSPTAQTISISNKNEEPLYYQIIQGGFDRETPEEEISEGIEILREFLGEDLKPVKELEPGEICFVKISIRSLMGEDIPDVAIVDLLPACLEPIQDRIRALVDQRGGESSTFQPDHVEIREDRLVFYGTAENRLTTFTYPVRSVYSGQFKVPPLFAEAMYDNKIWAMQRSSEITVKE